MKKVTRILSAALVAVMVLSLASVAMAAETTVYIPTRLSKLNIGYTLDDFVYPTLRVKMSSTVATYGNEDDPTDPCPILAGEDADYLLYFSEKVDWAGAVVSSLDGGWINIDVDETGFGMIEGPLAHQPGMWIASGPCHYDEDLGRCVPDWYVCGGDYPYYAGKDYGWYSVNVSYQRNGKAYKVVVTLKDAPDYFKTGMDNGVMSITFECVNVLLSSIKKNGNRATADVWYISEVSAVYPDANNDGSANRIIGVKTYWRNDAKQNLASYRITYKESDGVYQITYAPNTVTIDESTWTVICKNAPSQAPYIHHYTADEPIYGEYYKTREAWENGDVYAVSGSGWRVNQWYAPGHGKRIRNIKYGTLYFKSPRVK